MSGCPHPAPFLAGGGGCMSPARGSSRLEWLPPPGSAWAARIMPARASSTTEGTFVRLTGLHRLNLTRRALPTREAAEELEVNVRSAQRSLHQLARRCEFRSASLAQFGGRSLARPGGI
jgi:hypothetical protein